MKYFHGYQKNHSFFEGWYLKHQSSDGVLALIPAYHIDRQGRRSASLQIVTDTESWIIPYSADRFQAASSLFYVNLDTSAFSEQGIHLDIAAKDVVLTGRISYSPFTTPSYDIMGPFCAVPFMQCRHGVLSLAHRLSGQVVINGRRLDFDGGIGYIEKDWGRSFPSRYIWTQCSWTDKKTKTPCCVMLSIADIPFAGTHFTGCIGSILFRGKEYRLATYKGVKILEYTRREIVVSQNGMLLHINLIKEQPLSLAAPALGSMSRTIKESAACQVRYQLFFQEKKVFDILCRHAGFEYSGFESPDFKSPGLDSSRT